MFAVFNSPNSQMYSHIHNLYFISTFVEFSRNFYILHIHFNDLTHKTQPLIAKKID